MNSHFEDALYYLKRSAEHAKLGVAEGLRPLGLRLRELRGVDPEPTPGRFDRVRGGLEELEARGVGKARGTLATARDRVRLHRAA